MVFNPARSRRLGLAATCFPFVRLSGMPKNAFQKVPLMMAPFSVAQRVGSLAVNGSKLFAVGTFASLIGTSATNVLICLRTKFKGNKKGELQGGETSVAPKASHQEVIKTSLLYGAYMGISSNVRYQMVAGIEERLLARIFSQSGNFALASGALRVANTYLGSLLWVDTLRLAGMQPAQKQT